MEWFTQNRFYGVDRGVGRVVLEFLKQLNNFPEHQFYLINTNYDPNCYDNLEDFRKRILNFPNVFNAAIYFRFLRINWLKLIFNKINRYFNISIVFPYISTKLIKESDVYYSSGNSIPRIIMKNRKIKIFFISFDIIPLIRPDLSTNFLSYTKDLYDKLPASTNIIAISILPAQAYCKNAHGGYEQ